MKNNIPSRVPTASKAVGTIEWLMKAVEQLNAKKRIPAEQEVYVPVGDRRKRKEWNAADPNRRAAIETEKRMAKIAQSDKPSRAERLQQIDTFFKTRDAIKTYGVLPTESELLQTYIDAELAGEPNAGKRRRQTLIRKAKARYDAGR